MANFKFKIILFVVCLLTIFGVSKIYANSNIPVVQSSDYETIYNSLEEADFDYLFGIDPYQADEYKVYMRSPYPLFRSGVNLVFKTKTIPAGYYLLTPREKNGKTYILFKENGRVSYTIPVYKEDSVSKDFYKEIRRRTIVSFFLFFNPIQNHHMVLNVFHSLFFYSHNTCMLYM